jgi:hypothetical protein
VPNRTKNRAVNIADVLAVLFNVEASATGACGDNLNDNSVRYDCDKGVDTNGGTMAEIPPDSVPDGRG